MPRLASTIKSTLALLGIHCFLSLNAGIKSNLNEFTIRPVTIKNTDDYVISVIYDSTNLARAGLKKDAFIYAYKGYLYLQKKAVLNKDGLITICDFSQSSKKKRLYLIDLNEHKLVLNTYVAHGRNSGGEFAKKFSNRSQSLQSSLGFYLTKKTYYGNHGLALILAGLEKGFNDKAEQRKIVLHGSDYIGDNYLRLRHFMGRSFGCPAIPQKYSAELIQTIKNGTCLFIYHPNKNYLTGSKILNG